MHRLLQRQIKKHAGEDFDISSASKLLEAISASYDELYNEKKFLEHTLDVNSKDLEKANSKILEQNKHLHELLDKSSIENEETLHLLKQYKKAIDESLIVSTTDLTGKIKYVNDNFCKISGYTKDELVGKPHNIVRHPENKKEIFKNMWESISDKKVWHGIFPNLAKDGSTYYVNSTIVPLLNTNGEIVEFMALREDVTKTINYQNKINAEKNRVSEILNNQESIIVLFNKENGLIEANKKFYEIFDFESLNGFKKKHSCICELFEEKDNFLKSSSDDYFWAATVLNEPSKVHLAMIHKRVYSVKIATILIDEKETYLATFTDITDIEEARIKSKEAEITKANFLANMSHEIRTPMNAIVGFSQLLAKTELDSKQTKFVNLIKNSSTTLIDIINDILDFSKLENKQVEIDLTEINPFMEFEETFMLLSERAKEKNISYTIDIDHNLQECIEIDSFHIKQILMNLIGNAIKFTSENGIVDIKIQKILYENDNYIRFSVSDTGIGIAPDRQSKIFEPFSQADSSTTREFGGTGLGLSISNSLTQMLGSKLKLESEPGKGSKFYFDIKYKGCTPKETLKTHLEKYDIYLCTQSDLQYKNISMQLDAYSIKFQTVSAYDNTIDLDSSIIIATNKDFAHLYKNAKVLLLSKEHLECEECEDSNTSTIELFEDFPSIIYNELMRLKVISTDVVSLQTKDFNLKVLVAEDYEINRILISELLEQYNVNYEFAFNGEEAVEKVKERSYDLIFMDINMPVMNGMDATRIIINELKINTPIVALTANALDGDKENFISLGMVDYLSKPIDIKAFETLLNKYNKNTILKDTDRADKKIKEKALNIDESLQQASKSMNFPQHIIQKLFISYVESLDEIEENLKNSIEKSEFAAIEINAHNLKSGAASLCFQEITKLAKDVEKNAREKNKEFDYKTVLKELKKYFALLREKTS